MGEKHPGDAAATYNDLEQAVEELEPDLMVLVTPPETHREQVAVGCSSGVPLLVEKPLAGDLEEAVELAQAAERAAVPMSVCLNFRYLEVTQGIRKLVSEQTLGKPNFAQFTYIRNRDGKRPELNRYPLFMDHPMLLEQSIHHFDLIRYVYGQEVEWVLADTWNPPWSMYAHDSNVSTLLQLENGLRVNYLGTWTSGWDDMDFRWRTDCEDGVIIQSKLFSELHYAKRSGPDDDFEYQQGGGGGGGELKPVPFVAEDEEFLDDTQQLLERFAEALEGREPVPSTAWDHLKSLAVVFACIKSVQEERKVFLEELYEDYGFPGKHI
jgi:predicted dehydrogenase